LAAGEFGSAGAAGLARRGPAAGGQAAMRFRAGRCWSAASCSGRRRRGWRGCMSFSHGRRAGRARRPAGPRARGRPVSGPTAGVVPLTAPAWPATTRAAGYAGAAAGCQGGPPRRNPGIAPEGFAHRRSTGRTRAQRAKQPWHRPRGLWRWNLPQIWGRLASATAPPP
jgi:hypothetical protein